MVDALGNAPSEPKGKRFTVFPVSLTEYASMKNQSDWTWTSNTCDPNAVLYQVELHFDKYTRGETRTHILGFLLDDQVYKTCANNQFSYSRVILHFYNSYVSIRQLCFYDQHQIFFLKLLFQILYFLVHNAHESILHLLKSILN